MAGRRGRQITAETIDAKITKAQEKVVAAKAAYDQAAEELKALINKREAIIKDDLYDRLIKSQWSYQQLIKLLSSPPPEE